MLAVAQDFGRGLDFGRLDALQKPEDCVQRAHFVKALVAVERVVQAEDLQVERRIAQAADLSRISSVLSGPPLAISSTASARLR